MYFIKFLALAFKNTCTQLCLYTYIYIYIYIYELGLNHIWYNIICYFLKKKLHYLNLYTQICIYCMQIMTNPLK